MELDLELYRHEIRLPTQPLVRLSAIDIAPDHYQHTLFFLHGYGGRAIQWRYQICAFSEANRTIALDLRGHGLSDKPRNKYSMEQILQDLEYSMQALGVNQKIILAGHSFGGALATEYAVKHPNQVQQLILIATTGEFRLNPLYRWLLKFPYSILQLFTPFVRGWLSAPPHVMKSMYQQTLKTWNGWSLFRSLQIPTLVIRGHMDIVFEKPAFDKVTQAIADAEEIDVGASGHMVMLERKEAVNRAILRTLETTQKSWRMQETPSPKTEHTILLEKRPWLRYYDQDVPMTIAIPRIPLHHLLRSAVRRFPYKTAIYFAGSRFTYRRLNREANRFANALHTLGFQKGDRVMLLLPNLPQLIIAYFGTLKAGGVVVFTLPNLQANEIIRQLQDCQAKFLVTLSENQEIVNAIKQAALGNESSSLKHMILTQALRYVPMWKRTLIFLKKGNQRYKPQGLPSDASIHAFNALLYRHQPKAPDAETAVQDLAAIIYTGGTTDAPKGVMLSHRNLVANTLQTRHWIPDAKEGQERFLCALPFSHSYGLTTALNVPISIGAMLILEPKFEDSSTLKLIQRMRPTIFPGVPQMYVAIKDYPHVRKYGIASIKACISGSAPLPIEVQEAFEKLTRGRLVEGYGLTEASPVTHANPLHGVRKLGSIGIPFPNTEACVLDLRRGHAEVPDGQIGELAVRGPQVMLGYWNKPSDSQRVFTKDGWLLTGDVAIQDHDGYFYIIARKIDMWYPTKPGKPAFPRDVEEVLFEIPQVKEAAVVAVASQPIAFIISTEDRPSNEAIITYCKRRLPPELVPKLIIFLDDFPRSFIGKVLRRELAKLFEQNQPERSTNHHHQIYNSDAIVHE